MQIINKPLNIYIFVTEKQFYSGPVKPLQYYNWRDATILWPNFLRIIYSLDIFRCVSDSQLTYSSQACFSKLGTQKLPALLLGVLLSPATQSPNDDTAIGKQTNISILQNNNLL